MTLSALCVDFFVFLVATLSATAIACTSSRRLIKRRPIHQGLGFVGNGGRSCALASLVTGPPTLSSLAARRRFCFLVLFPLFGLSFTDRGPMLRIFSFADFPLSRDRKSVSMSAKRRHSYKRMLFCRAHHHIRDKHQANFLVLGSVANRSTLYKEEALT